MMDDDDFPVILGYGSMHELSDGDPRNPRLIGLKSVSDAASVALRRPEPRSRIGFHRPQRAR